MLYCLTTIFSKYCAGLKFKHCPSKTLAYSDTVTSPIVINVTTRSVLAFETKDSFLLWLAKFRYQKIIWFYQLS